MSQQNTVTSSFHAGPLPFITFSPSGQCTLEPQAARIIGQIKGKLGIISIAGLPRTGKTYLMNKLLGTDRGFESKQPTKGICVWGQPVQLGDDFFALLVDSEGVGLSSGGAPILSMLGLISSLLIYNTFGNSFQEELRNLHQMGKSLGTSCVAPKLLFALRDFSQPVTVSDFVDPRTAAAFPSVDCVGIPRPQEPNTPQFNKQLDSFIDKVYSMVVPKEVNGVALTGPLTVQFIGEFCRSPIDGSTLLSQLVAGSWTAVTQSVLRTALKESVSIYRSILNTEGMQKLPLGDAQVTALNNRAKAEARNRGFPHEMLASRLAGNSSVAKPNIDSLNQSISVLDLETADSFYAEFRSRRVQLLDHLKLENGKIATKQMETFWTTVVKKFVEPIISNSRGGGVAQMADLMEGWKSALTQFSNQIEKMPQTAVYQFYTKTIVPSILGLSGAFKPASFAQQNNRENTVVSPLNDTSLAHITDLITHTLHELRSAETDKRQIQCKAENDQAMAALERKFNKQLNEARRKNELLIDNLKVNYEQEAVTLRAQRSELQNIIHQLEKQNAEQQHVIETLTAEKANNTVAATVQQQAELVLKYLQNKSGFEAANQSMGPPSMFRPPLLGSNAPAHRSQNLGA